MVDNIEFTQIEMKVVEGLKTGNECLEQMHKIMSIEDVEQVMSDTQEAIEYQRVSLGEDWGVLLISEISLAHNIKATHTKTWRKVEIRSIPALKVVDAPP